MESNPTINRFLNKYWTVLFVLVVILNFIIRFIGVIDESLYGDEAFSVFFAQQSPAELFDRLLTDRNPPLYFFILHLWIKIVGLDAIYLKGLSVLFSTMTAVFLLLIGSRHIGKFAGFTASIFYLLSMIWIVESREIRAFALEGMLAVLSFYLYLNVVKKNKISSAVVLAIVNVLLLLSHYIAIYIPLVQLICSFIFLRSNRKGFKIYLISQIAAAIIYSPWVGIVIDNIPEKGSFWLEIPRLGEIWFTFISLSGNFTALLVHGSIIICFLLLLVWRKRNNSISPAFDIKIFILLLAWYIIPITLGFTLAQFAPIFRMKYVIYANLGLVLLLGYIIASLRYHFSILIMLVSIVIISQLKYYDISPLKHEEWKSVVERIKAEKDDNTTVLIGTWYKFRDFSYYYNIDYFKDYKNTIKHLNSENIFLTEDTIALKMHESYFKDKLVYIRSHGQVVDPDQLVRKKILQKFVMCSQFTGGFIEVDRFIKKQIPCTEYYHLKNINDKTCGNWNKSEYTDIIAGKTFTRYTNSIEYDSFCDIPVNADSVNKNSGNYGMWINHKVQFGPSISIPVKILHKDQKIEAHFFVKYENNKDSKLVFSIFKEGKDLYRKEFLTTTDDHNNNEWKLITHSFYIPEIPDPEAELRIYFWNPSESIIYLDDIEFRLFHDIKSK